MPAPGDTQERFGRSYIFVNPDPSITFLRGLPYVGNVGTVGTWRLSIDDEYIPGGGGDDPGGGGEGTVANAVLAAGEATTSIGTLLYIDNEGNARRAKADDIATSRVVGAAMTVANAGGVVKYGTNLILDVFNTEQVVDNDIGGLFARGNTYYLSAVNAGNWTLTPDTTTEGRVVIQCGNAIETNRMLVEIQTPTEV